jgi:hypothetical protein
MTYIKRKFDRCNDQCIKLFFFKDPPSDWIASLGFGGKVLCEAAKKKNDVDLHTAHVLSQV